MKTTDLPDSQFAGLPARLEAAIDAIAAEEAALTECRQQMRQALARGMCAVERQAALLQDLCGHQQLTLEFWAHHLDGRLPFDYATARRRMSLASHINHQRAALPALEGPLRRLFRQLAFEQLEMPGQERRGNPGRPHDPLSQLLAALALLKGRFMRLLVTLPLEQWPASRLKSLLADTEWVHELRVRAAEQLEDTPRRVRAG